LLHREIASLTRAGRSVVQTFEARLNIERFDGLAASVLINLSQRRVW